MIISISSYLWAFTTFLLIITCIFFLFYFNFTSIKLLKNVKSLNKESLKILNISLAGKIGVGSISGIAFSIIVGGKGTIIWIWLSTFLLSIITYLETKVGVVYRNNYIGGSFIYIKNVLNKKILSTIYILLLIFTFLFSFVLIQSNTIIVSISNTFFLNKKLILMLLIIGIFFSIRNGIKRISSIVSVLVPIMSALYIVIGIIVIINNYYKLPTIIIDIIKDSISYKSLLSIPFIIGFQRAVFSNESGMGTTSLVVALSKNNDYEKEYFFQAIGLFFISLVICTISALIVLTSDYEILNINNINGIEIINYAFNYHFGNYGSFISSIIISLFAFSTIITSYYYGSISIKYLFNNKKNTIIEIIVIIILVLSAFISPVDIWAIVDISTALLTIINIYSLIKIRKVIKER